MTLLLCPAGLGLAWWFYSEGLPLPPAHMSQGTPVRKRAGRMEAVPCAWPGLPLQRRRQ